MALQPDLSERAFQAIDSAFTFSERVKFAWLGSLTNIAEGLQSISIRRGIDIRDFTLMAYGAAGPMLLPSVLDLLPMRRVVIPPYPGLFSALGLVSSDQLYSEHRSSYTLLSPDSAEAIDALYNDIEAALLARVGADADVVVSRSFDGRLMGQGSDTPFVAVPMGPVTPQSVASLIAEFHAEYESRNGIRFEQLPVQAVTFRVEVRVRGEKVTYQKLERADGEAPEPEGSVMLEHLYESRTSARTYERGRLRPGHRLDGPAIVREDTSTTFVPIGRVLTVGDYGELVVE
jgi:N-methylhydantoinase A